MDNSSVQASEDNNAGDNVSNVSPLPKLSWTRRVEYILAKWADGASCFKWLHEQAYRKFKTKNNWFTIPVIILSTLTGALNVGMQGYVPDAYMGYAQIGVGSVNIFAGILTTLQSKFQYAEMSEAHFQAFVGWSRLSRLISNELSLERSHRRNPNDLVKICKAEYERLMEQSPLVPSDIVIEFEKIFGTRKEIIFPDIADHLVHTEAYDDIKERKDREREAKKLGESSHYIVHNQDIPPMTDEQRMNAINKWKSLRDVINVKKEAVEESPVDEEQPPPLLPVHSISARSQPPKPKPNFAPPAPRVPDAVYTPRRRSPIPGDAKVNVKQLANLFGPTLTARFGGQQQQTPQSISRKNSTSSVKSLQRPASVHSVRSTQSEPSIHTERSVPVSARSQESATLESIKVDIPPLNTNNEDDEIQLDPIEEVQSDGQDDDDELSQYTTFTEDHDEENK